MITLSEHNIKPYEELCRKLEENSRCAYVAATGTGKSYVAAKYIEGHGLAERTLVLVPSAGIADSWGKMGLPGIEVKTYHWLARNGGAGVLDGKELVVCDEMHHLGAAEWSRAWEKISEGFRGKVIGLTATPVRFLDNCRDMVGECFGGVSVEGPDLPSAIRDGILPHFRYVTALYDLPKRMPARPENGTGTTDRLFARLDLMESEHSFTATLRRDLCGDGRHAIVFANHISEIEGLMRTLSGLYPGASHREFHAKMSRKDALASLAAFGEDPGMSFLYTVDMLSEGVHVDAADTVIMFRRTESPIVYLQQIGRCLSSGNVGKDILIFDFAANHASVKAVRKGSRSVMEWVQKGSGENPERQVIVDDYAIEELELLEKLNWELNSFYWSAEEDRIVKENYGKIRLEEIMELLPGRTKSAVRSRARDLRTVANPDECHWSKEEDRILEENYGKMPIRQLASLLEKRTADAIKHRAKVLGLTEKFNPWTSEEDALLREMLKTMSVREIGRAFPSRDAAAIKAYMAKEGLHSSRPGNKLWTPEEDELLKKMLKTMSISEVCENFPGRGKVATQTHISRLGLHSSAPEFRAWTQEERNMLREMLETMPVMEVCRKFPGRNERAVKSFIVQEGLHSSNPTKRLWTLEENERLKEMLKTMPVREACKNFPGRTEISVKGHIKRLGLDLAN